MANLVEELNEYYSASSNWTIVQVDTYLSHIIFFIMKFVTNGEYRPIKDYKQQDLYIGRLYVSF